MTSKRLEFLKENPALLASYSQAMSMLRQSGVLDILREIGQVRFVPVDTPNYIHVLASEMQHSLGFNEALTLLETFVERFVNPVFEGAQSVLDFGAIERALKAGDLTKEEADAIRTGSPIPEFSTTSISKPVSSGVSSKSR